MADDRRSLNLVAVVVMIAAVGGVLWFLGGMTAKKSQETAKPTPEVESGAATVEAGVARGTAFSARQDIPLANARIVVAGDRGEFETTTDAEGQFEIELRDEYVVFHAESPGLRNAGLEDRGVQLRIPAGTSMSNIRLMLYEPCEVEGIVFGDGRPLEATVTAHFISDGSGATDYDFETVDTNVDGSFRLANLPVGRFELRFEASGFAPTTSQPIDVWAGDIIDVDRVSLERGGVIRGLVSDINGAGIPDVLVNVEPGSVGAKTDTDGSYELYGVPTGLVVVSAEREGYQPDTQELDLPDGGIQEANFALAPLSGIVVRVIDNHGESVNGALVTIRNQAGEVVRELPIAGEDLYLADLEGGPFEVEAHHDRYPMNALGNVAAGGTIELVLAADSGLKVMVMTSNGSLAPDSEVRLLEQSEDGSESSVTNWQPTNNGRLEFEFVAPGLYVVEAQAAEHRVTRSEAVTVVAGQEARTSVKLGQGGVVSGVVTDEATGSPIADARVGFETTHRSVQTDASGYFQLSGFPASRTTLIVKASGYRTELVSGVEVRDGERRQQNVALTPSGDERAGLELVGVGIPVQRAADGSIVVGAPVSGSPAERAGLQQGDLILAVDGKSTAELGGGLKDVVEVIRGEEGTAVQLLVQRGPNDQFEVFIERERVVMTPPSE